MCKWKNMIKRLIHDLFYIRPAIIPRLHVGMVRRYGDTRYNLVISFCILRYMLHRLPYPVHTAMYYVLYVVYIYTRFKFQFQNCNEYTCSRGDNSNFIFQTYQNCNNNTVSILILYYSFLHNMSYSITIALELSCIWRIADVN
jgi:hypothetical protein